MTLNALIASLEGIGNLHAYISVPNGKGEGKIEVNLNAKLPEIIKYLKEAQEDREWILALESAGLHDWEGYPDAVELVEGMRVKVDGS